MQPLSALQQIEVYIKNKWIAFVAKWNNSINQHDFKYCEVPL